MSQMYFNYFVSYCYKDKGKFGFNNIAISSDLELDSWKVIRDVEKDIQEAEKLDTVTIINWRRLK